MELEEVDRISHLPLHIIHDILALLPTLPKDATQTSVLCKRWKEIMDCFPIIYLGQDMFIRWWGSSEEMKLENSMFKEFVECKLKRFVSQNLNIQSMKLDISYFERGMMHCINRWVNIAMASNIKELNFKINSYTSRSSNYHLPPVVLTSNTLTSLEIIGCRIRIHRESIKLNSLRKLSLAFISSNVGERSIQTLISCCTTIEELRIENCFGIETLQVLNHPKLKILHLNFFDGLTCDYYDRIFCNVNLAGCKSLTHLTLENADMGDFFRDQLNCLLALEEFVLFNCETYDDIRISSMKLKKLVLNRCNDLVNAEINTPHLVSLDYTGTQLPFLSVDPSNLKEVKLDLKLNEHYRKSLQEFLGRVGHLQDSKLVVKSDQHVFIHEEPREILLPPFPAFELEIVEPSTSFENIIEDFWKSMFVKRISTSSQKLNEMVIEKLISWGQSFDIDIEDTLTEEDDKMIEFDRMQEWKDFTNFTIEDDGMKEWNAYFELWTTLPDPPTTLKLNNHFPCKLKT